MKNFHITYPLLHSIALWSELRKSHLSLSYRSLLNFSSPPSLLRSEPLLNSSSPSNSDHPLPETAMNPHFQCYQLHHLLSKNHETRYLKLRLHCSFRSSESASVRNGSDPPRTCLWPLMADLDGKQDGGFGNFRTQSHLPSPQNHQTHHHHPPWKKKKKKSLKEIKTRRELIKEN